jgi:ATP-dependent helicase/nuclease subunit B
MATQRNLYTIPPDAPFLRSLAKGLMGGPSEKFAKTLILLPTRRACRSLRDTFLDLNNGSPMLLPRMQPLGDVDQEELDLHLAGIYGVAGLPDTPPSMPPLKRLMLLSRLIRHRDPSAGHEQTLRLAASLATLIDQVHTENLDFSALESLVPSGDLSDHWKLTLEFLSIVTAHWPGMLADEGEIDPADRRNRLMQLLAKAWRDHPPTFPIIAAGSTGSIPATSALLDVISTLEQGAVILPGLDQDLDEESWAQFGDTHPQATLRSLLARFGVDRKNVAVWPTAASSPSSRVTLAREIMRPAATVQTWTDLRRAADVSADLRAGLQNLDLIEAGTLSDEAQAIAVMMRETLEQPGRTAALVTPDRELARRVSSALRKWDIEVDDSAGSTLDAMPAGQFLEAILFCVRDEFSPLSILNLLKHPRCRIISNSALLAEFEIKLCRGPRPSSGLAGLKSRLESFKYPSPALKDALDKIEAAYAPLLPLASGLHPASSYIFALIQISETFAGGRDGMWSDDDGEAASSLLAGLHDQAGSVPDSDIRSFQDILHYLLQSVTVRPRGSSHPRLVILGQLEARMMRSDVMILGSLNEGSWPADARHDPWMSRPMREQFGLPSPERSIGLSAHDFAQCLCSPRVIMTRSLKIDGAQTVPSRWLQRLSTLLNAADIPFTATRRYLDWAHSLQYSDQPSMPAERPEPRPPVEMRPSQLSATWIERWMRNPYHLYTRKILKLKPLDQIDQDLTAAERGSFIHKVLEEFLRECGDTLPPDAKDIFLRLAREQAASQRTDTAEWQFWWPRLERVADWFIAHERDWRQNARLWLQEAEGSYSFDTPSGSFTLTAKADRIDRLRSGGAAIIDYKTGEPPSIISMKRGENCQLPLEGLILRHGGYGGEVEAKFLSHWKISGGSTAGKIQQVDPGPADAEDNLVTLAEAGLKNLVLQYDQPDTPYTASPPGKYRYDEDRAIHHLSRAAEWSSADSEEDEEAA